MYKRVSFYKPLTGIKRDLCNFNLQLTGDFRLILITEFRDLQFMENAISLKFKLFSPFLMIDQFKPLLPILTIVKRNFDLPEAAARYFDLRNTSPTKIC